MDHVKRAKEIIRAEKKELENLCNSLNDDFNLAIDLLFNAKGKVIILGTGKSGHIGRKIASSLASTKTPSFYIHPSEALHGDLGMIDSKDVCILISNSGANSELIKILPFLKKRDIGTIAITNNNESVLAKEAKIHLCINTCKEVDPLNLAPTSSALVTLALGDAITITLMEQKKVDILDYAERHPGGTLGKIVSTNVESIMRKDLPRVEYNSDIMEILFSISEGKLGLTTVYSANKFLGIVTDGDVRRAIQKKRLNIVMGDVINYNPKWVYSDTLLKKAIDYMKQEMINHVLVKSRSNDKIIGVAYIKEMV